MFYSMTGYGLGRTESPIGTVTVELRSVNSRFLDIAARLPSEFSQFEPLARRGCVVPSQGRQGRQGRAAGAPGASGGRAFAHDNAPRGPAGRWVGFALSLVQRRRRRSSARPPAASRQTVAGSGTWAK